MSKEPPTYHEYWEQVHAVAGEIAEALREEADAGNAMGVDVSDLIHERIDSHTWMTYQHYQGAVMEHTEHPTYLTDVFGSTYLTDVFGTDALKEATGWYDIRQAFAFWAFRADVEEVYWDRFDDRGDRVQEDNRDEVSA